jgi:hypothetical protein
MLWTRWVVIGADGKEAEVDGGYLVGTSSRSITKNIVVIGAFPGTKAASARLS